MDQHSKKHAVMDIEAIDMMAAEAARIVCEQKRTIHALKSAVLILSILLSCALWYIVEAL